MVLSQSLGYLWSHFELDVRGECKKNSQKSLAVSSDSESEVEPFITQTKAALVAVLQLSFRKSILNLYLPVQAVDDFNFRTEDLLTARLAYRLKSFRVREQHYN